MMRTGLKLILLLAFFGPVDALFCPSSTPTGCIFLWFGYTMRNGDADSPDCQETCALFPPLEFLSGFECGECNGPTMMPSPAPIGMPSASPSSMPSAAPSTMPSAAPSMEPSTMPSTTPSKSPTESPVTPTPGNFDITLNFASNVPNDDRTVMQQAAARWENVIHQEFDSTNGNFIPIPPPSGCFYPGTIDDSYICVYYGDIMADGVLGMAMVQALRSTTNIPIASSILLKEGAMFGDKKLGLFTKVIGHALGLGRNPVDTCPGLQADLEYRVISGCTSPAVVPVDSCEDLSEDCLRDEVMTSVVDTNAILSKVTVGWLEDIGYSRDFLKYNNADAYDANNLGSSCRCSRRLSSSQAVGGFHRGLSNEGLSDEARASATEFGKQYLNERYTEIVASNRQNDPSPVNSVVVDNEAKEGFVIVEESGSLFVIRVERS